MQQSEAQFPLKVKANHDAPRAGSGENVNSNNSNFSWKINDQSEVNSSCSGGRADKKRSLSWNFMPVLSVLRSIGYEKDGGRRSLSKSPTSRKSHQLEFRRLRTVKSPSLAFYYS